ncbi:MAG: nitrate/nitrite transporter NrtS [Pseudomonadales bacterium]
MLNRTMILKGLAIAALVGTVLLIINQYDALMGDSELRVIPAILTYCVPFFVFIAGQLSSIQESINQG